MTPKVIALYLILLFFVTLCAFGSCDFTEEQMKTFKGLHPCAIPERSRDMCNKLTKAPVGITAPLEDRLCGPVYVSTSPTTEVELLTLVCQYGPNDQNPKAFIQGQAPNTVKLCEFTGGNVCYPTKDVPYP